MKQGIVLHQRFEFARINAHKNYCKIPTKPKNIGLNTFNVEDVDDNIEEKGTEGGIGFRRIKNIYTPFTLYEIYPRESYQKKSRATHYFYSNTPLGIRTPLEKYFKNSTNWYLTTKGRHIKNHYNIPFSEIDLQIRERIIIVKGDLITVKFNGYSKTRGINVKYFRTKWTTTGFSINLKTGNITIFRSSKNRMKETFIRRNCFVEINNKIKGKLISSKEEISKISTGCRIEKDFIDKFNKNLNDDEFFFALHSLFCTIPNFTPPNLSFQTGNQYNQKEWLMRSLIDLFVHLKRIKVPNEYHKLMIDWYPTAKFLKKNDNKLIASILDRMKIKSKNTIKILHEYPYLNFKRIMDLISIFGYEDIHKFIGNLDPTFFLNNMNYSLINESYPDSKSLYYEPVNVYELNDKEKTNILKLLNEICNYSRSQPNWDSHLNGQFIQIHDHIRMIKIICENG